MYFDNLTIVGIAAASLYAFVPLMFGRETLRIEDDQTIYDSLQREKRAAKHTDNPLGNDLLDAR